MSIFYNTGVAWLLEVRAVKCWINFLNERNSHSLIASKFFLNLDSQRTPADKAMEEENHFKSSWPLWAGLSACYNGKYNERQWCESEQIFKIYLSSDCFLQFENMKMESLVIVDQQATVNWYLIFVLTARHTLEIDCVRSFLFSFSWTFFEKT